MSLDSPQALCRVRLVPSNNYFIRLAGSLPNLSVTVSDVPVVQLVLSANTGVSLYCTVLGRISEGGSEVVECGTKMGLADRQTVVVRRPPESVLGLATQVVVAPDTIGDWQILQLNQAGWSTSMAPILEPCLEANYLYATKNQRGASKIFPNGGISRSKAPSRGLWMRRAGSLWHKRAGVAIPRLDPRH